MKVMHTFSDTIIVTFIANYYSSHVLNDLWFAEVYYWKAS